jgi:hypothetical protein
MLVTKQHMKATACSTLASLYRSKTYCCMSKASLLTRRTAATGLTPFQRESILQSPPLKNHPSQVHSQAPRSHGPPKFLRQTTAYPNILLMRFICYSFLLVIVALPSDFTTSKYLGKCENSSCIPRLHHAKEVQVSNIYGLWMKSVAFVPTRFCRRFFMLHSDNHTRHVLAERMQAKQSYLSSQPVSL